MLPLRSALGDIVVVAAGCSAQEFRESLDLFFIAQHSVVRYFGVHHCEVINEPSGKVGPNGRLPLARIFAVANRAAEFCSLGTEMEPAEVFDDRLSAYDRDRGAPARLTYLVKRLESAVRQELDARLRARALRDLTEGRFGLTTPHTPR